MRQQCVLSAGRQHFILPTALLRHFPQKTPRIPENVLRAHGQVGAMGQANYSASKGGIIAFTRTAALELARFGITVNVVAPGYTDTDMYAAVPAAIQAQIKSKIPAARFVHPEEIAKAVLYLVADGDYVTGQQINVNGARTCKRPACPRTSAPGAPRREGYPLYGRFGDGVLECDPQRTLANESCGLPVIVPNPAQPPRRSSRPGSP